MKERAEALTVQFDLTNGHTHNGTDGEGAVISASDLADINYYRGDWQSVTVTGVTGTSFDVTTQFSGKTSGGGASTAGVVTTPPNNRTILLEESTQTAIEDAGGQRVYGRITESSGTWTLSFYTNEAGTETAHNITSSTNLIIHFREVFTLANLPTLGSDIGQIPSLDATADVVDATATQRGVVSTAIQEFGGRKKFLGGLEVKDDTASFNVEVAMESTVTLTADRKLIVDTKNANITLSGDNSGDVTLASVGGTPNANAASLSGQQLTLQPADGSNPGVITAGTQTIGGNKTFSGSISASNLSGTNTGDVTLNAVGSSPNSNGASLSGQALTLQPADGTNPGLVSTSAQTFGGAKTFSGSIIGNNSWVGALATDSTTTGTAQTLSTPSTLIVRLTNATLVSVTGITAPSAPQFIYVTNGTGSSLDILNDVGATAANRILTGTGADLSLENDASIILYYDTTSSRWRVVGGSGSGGGGSSLTYALTTKTGNYTALSTDSVILCNASGGGFTITLPAAASNTGKFYTIKKTDSSVNLVTIDANSAEAIDGTLTRILTYQYDSLTICCDGSNWFIL